MNRIKKIMWKVGMLMLAAVLSLIFRGNSVQAESFKPSEYAGYSLEYKVTDAGVVITGYTGSAEGKLVIPEQINGVPVVEIGKNAFYNCNNFVGKLVIPNSVIKIGDSAFEYCNGLTGELIIPDSVTSIGKYVFHGCSGLTGELIIPDSVGSIGDYAFWNCSGFSGRLVISNGVTSIGVYAFGGCSGFAGNLVIADSVTEIGAAAFSECNGFTGELVIPDSITVINDRAFYNCSGFTGDLVIPASVVSIGGYSFGNCSGVTGLTLLGSEIFLDTEWYYGITCFDGCSNIAELKYGNKPCALSMLKQLSEGVPVYYPAYVVGWEETIELYPDINWIQYEPPVVEFVKQMYQVALNRTADEGGLKSWVNDLLSGNRTGADVAFNFIFSPEFKEKNYCNEHYIMQLYKAFMGREYDEGGLNYWLSVFEDGATREAVFNGFSQSEEFKGICASYGVELGAPIEEPQYGTVPMGPCSVDGKESGVVSFVKRLYSICLDRDADESGLTYWCGQLCSHESSGATAAYGFIFSEEFMGKNHSDADFVEYLYEAFMGRASEEGGKAYWLGRMANGEVTREDVFNGFAYSEEFVGICDSYGIVAY